MNIERKLELKGYQFTGIYTHDKEEAKARALELRKKGMLACVVTKWYQSRVTGRYGYSVYAKTKG